MWARGTLRCLSGFPMLINGLHAQDPARGGQRDEPGHAVPAARAPRLRSGDRRGWPAGGGPRPVPPPRPHPHGHEPARDRRVGSHPAAQGQGCGEGDAHHRPHRPRDVRGPREGARSGLRRLRHQAHRAAAPAREDRSAAGGPRQAFRMTIPAGGPPDRARDALLAHLRHELRTPVNAILGYSEMLLEDEAPAHVRPDLEKIQTAGRALLTLINEILDPARLGVGTADEVEAASARIRHDLRTPVNAILGYSEMLIEDATSSGQDGSTD